MRERMVYVNGTLVPASQATISVFDRAVQAWSRLVGVDIVAQALHHLRC